MSCMTNIIFGSIKLATEVILSGKNLSFLYKSESVTAISLVNKNQFDFHRDLSFFLSSSDKDSNQLSRFPISLA